MSLLKIANDQNLGIVLQEGALQNNMEQKRASLIKQASLVAEIAEKDVYVNPKSNKDKETALRNAVFTGGLLEHALHNEILERQKEDKEINQGMGEILGSLAGIGAGTGAGVLLSKKIQQPKIVAGTVGGLLGNAVGMPIGSHLGKRKKVESIREEELRKLNEVEAFKNEKAKELQNHLLEKYSE